jgi:aminomethyltransferase
VSRSTARKTPLHALHVAAGARMVDFAGWDMPVQYSGVIDEHLAVRTRAGLFDVSHMGEVAVRGPQALSLLQGVTTNDVSRLQPGRAQYSALTTPQGTFVDDLLVYMLGESDYLVVVNASNAPKDVAWLTEHAAGLDVEVKDVSPEWALLALQGPRALEILAPLASADPAPLRYYSFARADVAGVPAVLSRTGYTGEDGFELYLPADGAATVWVALIEAGSASGLVPAGLGARDTLRLEACMALYGNDIDATTTVIEADLAWIVKLDKGDFVGRDVLAAQKQRGPERRLVGFETKNRAVPRHGHEATSHGVPVGTVTSGSFAPFLRRNVGLAYLPAPLSQPGTPFEIDVRGRSEPATVVPKPFYKRAR